MRRQASISPRLARSTPQTAASGEPRTPRRTRGSARAQGVADRGVDRRAGGAESDETNDRVGASLRAGGRELYGRRRRHRACDAGRHHGRTAQRGDAAFALFAIATPVSAQFQTIETDRLSIVYPGGAESFLIPYLGKTFENSFKFQTKVPLEMQLPLFTVFWEAFEKGIGVYLESLQDPDALSAIKLTALVAVIAVPLNTAFGFCAAWTMKFSFKGRNLLISLIDLPFSVLGYFCRLVLL